MQFLPCRQRIIVSTLMSDSIVSGFYHQMFVCIRFFVLLAKLSEICILSDYYFYQKYILSHQKAFELSQHHPSLSIAFCDPFTMMRHHITSNHIKS